MQDKNARIHRKRLREFNLIKEEQLSRFCITFVPKSKTVPLTPTLIYWKQYKVYIT